jgi:hypothetical protein
MSPAPDLTARGRAYTSLCAELRRQGPLWPAERALLLDAADGLLFEEPGATARRDAALELLAVLRANDRRTDAEAGRLRDALLGCAAPAAALVASMPVPAPPARATPAKGASHAA